MKYENSEEYTIAEVESAILADRVDDLIQMVVSVSMFAKDSMWAESICLRLANHTNFNVRGNAVLGLDILQECTAIYKAKKLKNIVKLALLDEHPYVLGQADAAADDLAHFLGW